VQKALNYFILGLYSLFYSAFTNTITKITLLNSQKTFTSCEKDHPTPEAKGKRENDQGAKQ